MSFILCSTSLLLARINPDKSHKAVSSIALLSIFKLNHLPLDKYVLIFDLMLKITFSTGFNDGQYGAIVRILKFIFQSEFFNNVSSMHR